MASKIENALRWLVARQLRQDLLIARDFAVPEEEIKTRTENVLDYGEPDPDPVKILRTDMARKDEHGA